MLYKGWTIKYYPQGSQHWMAIKYSVTICNYSKDLLISQIDMRIIR